jgi:sterol desaturase/sphingolipid hydroxylase (fatty acid hydroxylase superfamily)
MENIGLLDLPIVLIVLLKAGITNMFLTVQGQLSVAKLLVTLGIGLVAFAWLHQRKSRHIRFKALVRAVFPQKLFGASSRADVLMLLFNFYLMGLVLGWTFLSQHMIANLTNQTLMTAFGTQTPTAWSPWLTGSLLTFALFIAYELAYWLDHYLSHRIPFLWEFHKVHHAAEVLTPITNFRVHPVDSIVFTNILALIVGSTSGLVSYLFGSPVQQFTIWNANALVLGSAFLVQQLHHTSFWIPFTGIWGRIFLSPAHHQIHHSLNPIHYDKNMGSTLSVFDWLFGTLHIPAKEREKLTFGVSDANAKTHTVEGLFVTPVIDAFRPACKAIGGQLSRPPGASAVGVTDNPALPGRQ